MTNVLLAVSLSLAALPVITLERTHCYGDCPVYKLAIFADGKVLYEGKDFVKRKGKAEGRITQAALQELVREFNRVNYLSLDDAYVFEGKNCPEWWTDSSSATTSLNWKGKQKTISHYHGCRGTDVLNQLTALEDKIDKIVETQRWIK